MSCPSCDVSKGIPTFDIGRLDSDRDAFVADLGAAYREWGFAGICGHGIPRPLIDASYEVFQQFFALPRDVKMRYHVAGSGGVRGYTPFGIETAKGSCHADLKEFWHVGRQFRDDGSVRAASYPKVMAPNLWPMELPEFRAHAQSMFDALDALGSRVLSALALHIGLPANWFIDKTDFGNSILRPIHYPPIASSEGPIEKLPNVRAGAHEDINLITLMVGASAEGLEVKSRQGEWVPFTAQADAIVVNIGDMLQRLTNHVYPSTTHRVVNPSGAAALTSRYSIPFFLHFNPDFRIETVAQCVTQENPDRYPTSITANDCLIERLLEIKLIPGTD